MKFASAVASVRKFLGILTDLLQIGRLQGWWSEKFGPKL